MLILNLFLCIVWGCVLTSLIHRQLSNFPNTTCWRDCFFPIACSCFLCWRSIKHRCVGFFLGSMLFHWSMCLFSCQHHAVSITIALYYKGLYLLLCSLSSGLLWQFGSLGLHINFRMEKELATHSSILAWRIPWTEKPGGLQSMGWQRVRHDRVHTHTHTHIHFRIVCSGSVKNVMSNLVRIAWNL